MGRRRSEAGYTLIELMLVIAIVGLLAFPEIEGVKTAAKRVGVETNFRTVITTIYGLQNHDDLAAKLTALFGDSLCPKAEDMVNPMTQKMGVATAVNYSAEPAAVYVLEGTVAAVPSVREQSEFRGAVVAIVQPDREVVVYGCDESGKLMKGLQRTIER